jgi:hypothetical protein
VTHEQTTGIGRAARWLLLLGTLFGLAAMHTLGHGGMRMDHDPRPAAVAMVPAGPAVTGVVAVPSPCPDGHCPDDHGAMSGGSICLAVLGGLALCTLLAALLVAWQRERGPLRGAPASAPGTPRAPPMRRTGLTLASAAVLRI